MNPIKAAVPLAKWFLRIALLAYIFLAFFGIIKTFAFNNLEYFIALAFFVFAVLLVVGGFMPSPSLTVISGLVICVLSIIKMVMLFRHEIDANFVFYLMPAAIGFYFLARGNQG